MLAKGCVIGAAASSRFTLRHDMGKGVGYEDGYTHLEAFIPLVQSHRWILFNNLRVVNFNHEDL